jgi:type IV pilus assembly protein PilA
MNNRSKKGFTLVEIMIVVVIIGLLAAMAIPAFQKVRENSIKGAMKNDARQLASAAQQYMLEYSLTSVTLTVTSADGNVTSAELSPYVRRIGKGTTSPTSLTLNGDFTMSNAQGGSTALSFTPEGQPK